MAEPYPETGTLDDHDSIHNVRTPTLISPPESKTPPTEMHKRHRDADGASTRRIAADAIDADALSRALEQFDGRQREREHTPDASPRRKRQRVIGDR